MKWRKLGVVYVPDGTLWWARTHATCPTPFASGNVIRVYIQCRDADNVGRVGFVEVAADEPSRLLRVHPEPVFDIGLPGTFDEQGVLPTSILSVDNSLYLYYVGFELGTRIRYRLLTGLATSFDGGLSFSRMSKVPILERSDAELFVRGGPFVLREDDRFRMWYVAGSAWEAIGGKNIPRYDLRHIISSDGVHWPSYGLVSMALGSDDHAFGRPYVIRAPDLYQLYYSRRSRAANGAYRLGYAESRDGMRWNRQDDQVGLSVSPFGWDSEAVAYSAVISAHDRTYMFYNGNDFGRTGFGVAVREE